MITTIGIFSTQIDAEFALSELRMLGIKEKNVSYVYVNNAGDLVGVNTESSNENDIVTDRFFEALIDLGIKDADVVRCREYLESGDFLIIVRLPSRPRNMPMYFYEYAAMPYVPGFTMRAIA